MGRNLPPLTALRAFEAAARHLGFSRAADELNVTQSAVSRQVKALEQHLGVKLFERLPRALQLTVEGHEYLDALREAFDRVEQATVRLHGRREGGVLTVSVLPTFAMRWLIPRLSRFTEAHPAIEVRMITSIRAVDFDRDDIDVAIRVGRPRGDAGAGEGAGAAPRIDLVMTDRWERVRAVELMPDVLVPVCTPALRDGDPPLNEPGDLARHVLLHTASRAHAWPDYLRALDVTLPGDGQGPSYGHFFMTLQAAAQGRGVALVPRVLVEEDLTAGTLVMPFDGPVTSAGAYYLLCRSHQWNSGKIRAFREWLLSLRAHAPGGDGRCDPVAAVHS